MAMMPVRVMGTKILGCSPTTGVKDSKRGFGCSQKGWVTSLSRRCKAVVMTCLLLRGSQGRALSSPVSSKRCCCSGSGHVRRPPLSQGWVTSLGASRGDVCVETAGRGRNGAAFFGSLQEERGVQLCSEPSLGAGRSRRFRSGVKPLLANLCTAPCPSSSLRERCWGAQQPGTAGQGTACPRPHFTHGERHWIDLGFGTSALQTGLRGSGRAAPHVGPLHVPCRGRAATALVSRPATPKTRLPPAGCSPKASERLPAMTAACRSCQHSFPRDHPSWARPFSGKASCLAAGREPLPLALCRDVPRTWHRHLQGFGGH